MSKLTSLGIGGTTDLLRIKKHEGIPDLLNLLERAWHAAQISRRRLEPARWRRRTAVGGDDAGASRSPTSCSTGNFAQIDAAADLGRTVTYCAKNDLGGMEGLIGVPGTIGGALRMNAGAYGMQIGSLRT